MNYAHLMYGMQMASATRAWMYRQPQEDWENFLSGFNGFPNQAEADMIVSTRRNSHNGKSFFIIWSHVVSQKNYMCWNKHGEEGLNELEAGCLRWWWCFNVRHCIQ
jgi:hypothetical protein